MMNKKKAAISEVGIFWIHDGDVIQDSVPFTEGDDYGDYSTSKTDHYTYWNKVQRGYPELRDYEYDEIPRGRVAFNKKDKKFYIYGSKKFTKDTKSINKVLSAFNIKKGQAVIKPDDHYEMINYEEMLAKELLDEE